MNSNSVTRHIIALLLALIIASTTISCGIYSFSGASIDPGVKTVSIEYFNNNASIVNATLSSTLTEALKDRLLSKTSLTMTDNDGDMQFSGAITSYTTTPQAITSNQTAALNRLSITVKVTFVNTVNEKSSFENSFTRYMDYDSSLNLSDVEDSLVEEIVESLVDDIFNQAIVNW
ncbi:MAG: LptE family protein [Bacteroidales bacterium]|nr:LptE family protein [Bacteroidales bacterium]